MNLTNELSGEIEQIVAAQELYLRNGRKIYDQEFLDLERQDPRYKVAIDLDGVLTSDEGVEEVVLREGALEFLTRLREHKSIMKLSLWTSSPREITEAILKRFGLGQYFDTIITRENYELIVGVERDQIWKNHEAYPEIYEYQQKYPTAKPLGSIDYDILLDDSHGFEAAQVNSFQLIRVPQFSPAMRTVDPIPMDIATKVITAAQQSGSSH